MNLPLTPVRFLRYSEQQFPSKTAVVCQDLRLTYAEFGDPEHQWISVRVGRQLINYNHTIIANSEWRDQGRSYDAVVTNLHYRNFRLGIFAASAVVPLDEGDEEALTIQKHKWLMAHIAECVERARKGPTKKLAQIKAEDMDALSDNGKEHMDCGRIEV